MLLLFLIALALGPAGRGPAPDGGAPRPRNDFTNYLAIAAAYGSASHAAALREIREWRPREIDAAVDDLRRRARKLRAAPSAPEDIAFATVEAAVLMHAEAGLLALQSLSLAEAEVHLRASTALFEWSRGAATEARNLAEMRRLAFKKGSLREPKPDPEIVEPEPEPEIVERVVRQDYYVALAAAALAIGFPPTALPFAEKARLAAPLDPEVQLVFACVAESLAQEQLLRHRESEAARLRDEADRALRDALALDPGLDEARVHLGRLLLVRGRLVEAEPVLEPVERRSSDARQRYLARLFLGRLAQQRARPDEAAGFYGRALEVWPDSQAARLALSSSLEVAAGPAAARPLVAASLAESGRLDRAADPWWLYLFGPPGVAKSALNRVWRKALDR
jgi:tetratricopeptide (TPR) repeat protein